MKISSDKIIIKTFKLIAFDREFDFESNIRFNFWRIEKIRIVKIIESNLFLKIDFSN